ncbi:unnamed protein product [Cuscuta campestris]|uniref:Uncharacterized protein n=1 Tax=Cuscuta campestris TaxID=132261 RepID=A0A484MPU9_9ASTE|nr:unnamed protein product [Cuscuta campestris]
MGTEAARIGKLGETLETELGHGGQDLVSRKNRVETRYGRPRTSGRPPVVSELCESSGNRVPLFGRLGGGGGCGESGGRDGPGTGGGDDGGLGLLEEPLDGLAVGLVAEFAGELEDPGGAEGGHADSPATAVDLLVPVFVGAPLDEMLLIGGGGGVPVLPFSRGIVVVGGSISSMGGRKDLKVFGVVCWVDSGHVCLFDYLEERILGEVVGTPKVGLHSID